jgi:hypothetical protein
VTTYTARVLENRFYQPGAWHGLRVGIFRTVDGQEELVGEYTRNYPSLFDTFFHFRAEGKDLALYSPHYTATRILALPECIDLGGEEPTPDGFCPVDFYVPTFVEIESVTGGESPTRYRKNDPGPDALTPRSWTWNHQDPLTGETRTTERHSRPVTPLLHHPFGFVAGCVWGDDNFWKVQYLDLFRARQGIVTREDRFGYIELPSGIKLANAIDMGDFGDDPAEDYSYEVTIAVRRTFDLRRSGVKGR